MVMSAVRLDSSLSLSYVCAVVLAEKVFALVVHLRIVLLIMNGVNSCQVVQKLIISCH